jgi:hypothetical protein
MMSNSIALTPGGGTARPSLTRERLAHANTRVEAEKDGCPALDCGLRATFAIR